MPAWPLFLLIGFALGLLGGGGSILAVPVLVYVVRVDAHQAVPMSLAIVGATAAGAAVQHWRAGNVDGRSALLFGAAGVAGAWVGARFTGMVSRQTLLLLFALLMIVIASRMLRGSRDGQKRGDGRGAAAGLAAGAAVGVVSGFLGVGGGFLIVPALVFFCGLEMKKAVGTSLVVIAITAASGLTSHLQRVPIDGAATALFTLVALAGTWLGVLLARRLSSARLRQGFGGLVLALGLVIGYLNLPRW